MEIKESVLNFLFALTKELKDNVYDDLDAPAFREMDKMYRLIGEVQEVIYKIYGV